VSSYELRTGRLRLVPLDAEAMSLLVQDWPALQQRLGARESPAWITDSQTLVAARQHRDRMLREPGAWLWWTFWQVVQARDATCVGLVDFKGPPGPDGGVAVGCAFASAYWGHGYATEAVAQLVAWALEHSDVRFVIADTAVDNHRAHRVLRKLGFVSVRGEAGLLSGDAAGGLGRWRLVRPGDVLTADSDRPAPLRALRFRCGP
jgi:RimJ/RimL family protein N-acetyltransferase